jgi:hypothetical protein
MTARCYRLCIVSEVVRKHSFENADKSRFFGYYDWFQCVYNRRSGATTSGYHVFESRLCAAKAGLAARRFTFATEAKRPGQRCQTTARRDMRPGDSHHAGVGFRHKIELQSGIPTRHRHDPKQLSARWPRDICRAGYRGRKHPPHSLRPRSKVIAQTTLIAISNVRDRDQGRAALYLPTSSDLTPRP